MPANQPTERIEVDPTELERLRFLSRFPDENPNPVLRINTDHVIIYANRPAQPVLDGLGVGVGGAVPEDLKFAVEDAVASGDPQNVIVDAHRVTYSLTIVPVRGRAYLNVFGMDVTRQRQAERRIHDLARFPDENPNPIMRLSRDYVVLYANEPSRPILSAWDIEVGRTIPEALWPRVESGFKAERSVYAEVRFGASIYALQIAPVRGAEYANVYGRDVTRLKQAEADLMAANAELSRQNEELAEKNAELTRANRLKDEFLANTSHELRTPLNGIVGIAESLIDGAAGRLSAPVRDNLGVIVSSGRRLARLVNDILDFSRLQHEELELSLRAVDLRTAVDVVLLLFRPLVQKKGISLRNVIEEDLPLVLADEDRLQQILHNLVGNAVKFTEEGTVEISAAVRADGRELAVTVRDTGIGIEPDVAPHVFDAFAQGDGAPGREYGGTGLGLSVTRALVSLHGGEIDFESAKGEGSSFTFTVPIATREDVARYGEADAQSAEEIVSRLGGSEAPTLASEDEASDAELDPLAGDYAVPAGTVVKVLIVDDDPINLRVLNNHLAPRGYTVHQAESGHEALALLNAGLRPDLVLLDVMMPRMSGYEVCRELRRLFPANEVPVVLVTARTQVSDLVNGLNSGANDYLTKPISKTELLARLRTHLVNARMSTAAGRFVPREFLKILGHETLVDVARGDHMQREMSVFFSDIRSFTNLVEGRTPEQNFAFINEYLAHMEPPIRAHDGFIDSYEGDAIMALFEGGADDAVQAGIDDLVALGQLNTLRKSRGETPIRIGIGINTGTLMLGTIGGEERIKCGVIGDPVNLAARIEGMTKRYRSSLLISENTYDKLRDPTAYAIRPLDRVIVKGRTEPVTVYEVLDGLPEEERQARLSNRERYVGALEQFRVGEISDALAGFSHVRDTDPTDAVSALFVERCRQLLRSGVPAGWNGVVELDTK